MEKWNSWDLYEFHFVSAVLSELFLRPFFIFFLTEISDLGLKRFSSQFQLIFFCLLKRAVVKLFQILLYSCTPFMPIRYVKHWFFFRNMSNLFATLHIEANYLSIEIIWTEIVLIRKVTKKFATSVSFSLRFYDGWMCLLFTVKYEKISLFSLCFSFTMFIKNST